MNPDKNKNTLIFDNNETTMVGEILYYEHSDSIKLEPEDIAFYNEGIIDNASTINENAHPVEEYETIDPSIKEVKSEIHEDGTLPNEDLLGGAIDEVKSEIIDKGILSNYLVGEAIDFNCGVLADTSVCQELNCGSKLAEQGEENEKVKISVLVDTCTKTSHNGTDFYIQQSYSDSSMLYKCNMCPTPHFFKRNYLENPHKAQHQSLLVKEQPPKIFVYCEVPGCEYKTCGRSKLAQHAIVHSTEVYKCDECEFTTKSKKSLGKHKDNIHNPDFQRFFCKQCPFNSISQTRLQEHEVIHKDPEQREIYKCSFEGCTFKTTKKCFIKRHAIVHKDPSELEFLKCPSCPYLTIFKHKLRKHSEKHKNKIKEKLYCFNCPFETVSKLSLKNHMLTHTKVEALKMFKCSQCSYMAKRKGNLLQHMVKHLDKADIEMFKCSRCSFETKRKHSLRNHMDTHKKS